MNAKPPLDDPLINNPDDAGRLREDFPTYLPLQPEYQKNGLDLFTIISSGNINTFRRLILKIFGNDSTLWNYFHVVELIFERTQW